MAIAFEFSVEMLGKTHRHEAPEYFWSKYRIKKELRLMSSRLAIAEVFQGHNEVMNRPLQVALPQLPATSHHHRC